MSETTKLEVEEHTNQVIKMKSETPRRAHHDKLDPPSNARPEGIILSKLKPSYALRRGIGILRSENRSLRWKHRNRLRYLLKELMRGHNRNEASGVLSVLLKGSCREKSVTTNRFKYVSSMELLKCIKGELIDPRRIQNIYELWMKKIGVTKGCPMKDTKFGVLLEFILFCLTRKNIGDAHQAIICLMQEHRLESDPTSNFVVGLTFCQMWHSSITEEFQLNDADRSHTPMRSKVSETGFNMSMENSEGHNSVEVQEADSPLLCNSNTSIRIGKEIGLEVGQHRDVSMEVDDNPQREIPHQNYHPQYFYMDTERSGQETSISNHGGNMQCASIFYAHGMESWLLPLRLPHLDENLEDIIYLHRKFHNDYYKNAVKYLRLAIYSTPPVSEALHPLIQMLLLGDQVKEALDELEKFVDNSDTALPLRLKASLLEHFERNNDAKLSKCFEDILKRDPTCTHSLARLVSIHQNGYYTTERLVEMIALHLDATYAEYNIWKEFASCFLKLSQCEEDRMSMCLDSNEGGYKQKYYINFDGIPRIFTNALSKKTWRLRCRWWLTRHFSQNLLASEVLAGDLQLLTYKAASASHLYGQKFEYVIKASACLEEKNKDMLSFLQIHMQNSVGLYLNIDPKNQ